MFETEKLEYGVRKWEKDGGLWEATTLNMREEWVQDIENWTDWELKKKKKKQFILGRGATLKIEPYCHLQANSDTFG